MDLATGSFKKHRSSLNFLYPVLVFAAHLNLNRQPLKLVQLRPDKEPTTELFPNTSVNYITKVDYFVNFFKTVDILTGKIFVMIQKL